MRRFHSKRAEVLAVVALLFAAPAFAFAQDAGEPECTLNADVVVAPFKAKLPKQLKLLETKTEAHSVIQRLQMPDGAIATVSIGGCEHLGFSMRIERADLGDDLRKGLAAVTSSLRSLPLNEYPKGIATTLLGALGKAKVSKSPADLPCGDGFCRFELRPGEALISYDFAL